MLNSTSSATPDANGRRVAALVVGGASGLGGAVCERLIATGWAIALTYHWSAATALALRDRLEAGGAVAACFGLDATDPSAVERCFTVVEDSFAPIGAMVYLAGASTNAYLREMTSQVWHEA